MHVVFAGPTLLAASSIVHVDVCTLVAEYTALDPGTYDVHVFVRPAHVPRGPHRIGAAFPPLVADQS